MVIDIRKPLKKLLPHLLKAQEENLNEADTVLRILKVFEEVLGYDIMADITRENQVKEKYVDIAIKIDGTIRLLVEVKAAGIALRDRHIDQAKHYAAEGNIRWVLLTNGVAWHLYHLSFEDGVEYEQVFAINLSPDSIEKDAELLSLLHRQSLRKEEHQAFWEHRAALSPESIGKAIFTEDVLRFIRREIRKNEGILTDEEDLANAIHELLSTEARERIGPLRIYRKHKPRTKKRASTVSDHSIEVKPDEGPDGNGELATVGAAVVDKSR